MSNSQIRSGVGFLFAILLYLLAPVAASAASIALEPAGGSYVVGSTFQVSIFLNTNGVPVNAVQVKLKFPSDKMQLVSPSTGNSIISLWTSQPTFDNREGTMELQGVIPNGITTSRGLITTLVFRVKAPGDSYIKFLDDTKVLKHDGLGTDVLDSLNGAIYHLILPPPAGPLVASQTHPDPTQTYRLNSVVLSWIPEDESGVTAYSYMLSGDAIDIPDDIAEGGATSLVYKNIADGTHYFHIKSYRRGVWGGTTHFPINIDVTPPAEFSVAALPSYETTSRQPVIQFTSTDAVSGLDHYELKVVPLFKLAGSNPDDQQIFIEATSPYIMPPIAENGKYDVIIRAYDKAGNYREETAHLSIISVLFQNMGIDGIEVRSVIIPWWAIFMFFSGLLLILAAIAMKVRERHARIEVKLAEQAVSNETSQKLAALKEKQKQFIKITTLSLFVLFMLSIAMLHPMPVIASTVQTGVVEPPIITTLSRDITNDEIFYVGGLSSVPTSQVVIYIQNRATGEVMTERVDSDAHGEWFYRHSGFLQGGDYVLWAQSTIGGQSSPPSPQENMVIHRAALQFGSSRISYGLLFGIVASMLLFLTILLICYIYYHHRNAKEKHVRWMKEVREAELAVRDGFLLLRRDIEAELDVVRRMKLTRELKAEEMGREQQLLKDLAWAESNITKEVTDIEKEL